MKKGANKDRINSRKIGQILGINVTGTCMSEVLAGVEKLISDNINFYIVTPNPEIILMAQKDKELKNAMNGTELAIPDGVGLKFAIPDLNIIKGRELFSELIKLANEKGWKVFLLGGLDNEAELAVKELKIAHQMMQSNLKLKIDFHPGPVLNKDARPATGVDRKIEHEAIEKINRFAPQLLFVAFGNPKQEIWVHENYLKLNIGGAMAVGGVFRYVAGLSALPPKWIAHCGLEWLWRLLTEPRRIGRIWNAIIVFPLKVLLSRLNGYSLSAKCGRNRA
jgi:N-acetylglucosaminyldiphosphoundecaprenol N-acetyl-beta-D-mannosaminyltransferase